MSCLEIQYQLAAAKTAVYINNVSKIVTKTLLWFKYELKKCSKFSIFHLLTIFWPALK